MAFDRRVLNGIGVLTAVIETGTFVRAAAALGLTQSGVSRAIARLEERVGVRLLNRSARAVRLTDEGRRFYDAVAPLMAGIEDAASDAAGASRKPRGLLRVAIDSLVARAVIGPRIAAFLGEYPVHWAACLRGCVEAGASTFLELGPGRALSEMAKSAYPAIPARSLEDFRTLEGARAWLARLPS
jgi:DNA-binding transcriptional LysR family regulator